MFVLVGKYVKYRQEKIFCLVSLITSLITTTCELHNGAGSFTLRIYLNLYLTIHGYVKSRWKLKIYQPHIWVNNNANFVSSVTQCYSILTNPVLITNERFDNLKGDLRRIKT